VGTTNQENDADGLMRPPEEEEERESLEGEEEPPWREREGFGFQL